MKRRIGFAVLYGFLLACPFELRAHELSPEEQKLAQEYFRKKGTDRMVALTSPVGRQTYQTPQRFEDSALKPEEPAR